MIMRFRFFLARLLIGNTGLVHNCDLAGIEFAKGALGVRISNVRIVPNDPSAAAANSAALAKAFAI